MEMILLEAGNPGSGGGNLAFDGKQAGMQHVGMQSWFGTEYGIAVSHYFIYGRQIQGPELLHILPQMSSAI